MVIDLCPMHIYLPAYPRPPCRSGSCAEVQNSWLFDKLKFLRHSNDLAKTERGLLCLSVPA